MDQLVKMLWPEALEVTQPHISPGSSGSVVTDLVLVETSENITATDNKNQLISETSNARFFLIDLS